MKTQKTATKEIQAATINRVSDKSGKFLGYLVKSDSQDEYYQVTWDEKAHGWQCNCKSVKPCKHCRAVEQVQAARVEIAKQQETTPAATAEEVAAVEESKAEAKMNAFLKSMDEQYASDPRRGLSQGEMEAARSNMVHLYDAY